MATLLTCPRILSAVDDATLREEVMRAISSGQKFIVSQQAPDGSWNAGGIVQFPIGTTGLAVLALINTGMKADDPPIAKALKYFRSIEDFEGDSSHKTYEMSLMLQALAAVKTKSARDRALMRRLAETLQEYQRDAGGWRYDRNNDDWDNSATQFALLGLREAAMAGIPIDRNVWRKAQEHWLTNQVGTRDNPNGAGWGYSSSQERETYGSMTVAGIASLVITSSQLQDDGDVTPDDHILCCQNRDDEIQRAIDAGNRWLTRHFAVSTNPQKNGWTLYYLYGLERAGRFSGIRFFGDHDWYREGAGFLVSGQDQSNGSWVSKEAGLASPVIDTSFALLFLSKGLAPVAVNKLKFGQRDRSGEPLTPDWNRHPRDVANLIDNITTRDQWPQFLNWQIVDLEQAVKGEGVSALLQAPVQFLSGSENLNSITDQQVELLRDYLLQGGFLFASQTCEGGEFDASFRQLVIRLFPEGDYSLRKLPTTHDVYRSEERFTEQNAPELWGVDFGCRTAIMYAPFDHGCRWQKWARFDPPRRTASVKAQVSQSIKLGVNVIAYATNRELRSKLERPEVLAKIEGGEDVRGKIAIARLRHTGGWDAAPNALRHLRAALQQVGFDMADESPNVPATDESLKNYPLTYMHGRKNFALTQEERDSLRSYLNNGGVLFADACCGSTQFDASFRAMIEQMYGKPLELIPPTHELYKLAQGNDIREVSRRMPGTDAGEALRMQESRGVPILEGVNVDGRYPVIYSKYDISCALEQQNTFACAGYSREDAAKIAMNMVIYALVQ
jgi:hypothetical protein